MLLKIKTFGFQQNYTRYEKNVVEKIVHLKKIFKFTADHFLIKHDLKGEFMVNSRHIIINFLNISMENEKKCKMKDMKLINN